MLTFMFYDQLRRRRFEIFNFYRFFIRDQMLKDSVKVFNNKLLVLDVKKIKKLNKSSENNFP